MAVKYYTGFPNPSWPFWLLLFAITAYTATANASLLSFSWADLWFFSFVAFAITSFALFGVSSTAGFARHVALMCVVPYLCGWILGKFVPFNLLVTLRTITFVYVALLAFEVARNPTLFATDRPMMYVVDAGDGWGGDPTSFNIGITLGSAWVAAFSILTIAGQNAANRTTTRGRLRLIAVLLGLPVVLLFVGSRTSVVAVVLSAITVLIYASWISLRKKVRLLGFAIIAFPIVYLLLPQPRKELINDVPIALSGVSNFLVNGAFCSQSDGSVMNRVVLLSEAWRLFRESPIIGIGGANYGVRWCGVPVEFGGPHSIIAQILAEYGLLGFLLFGFAVTQIVRMVLRRMPLLEFEDRKELWVLFGLWVFVLIQAQFIGNIYEDFQVFLLTGLLASAVSPRSRWFQGRTPSYTPWPA